MKAKYSTAWKTSTKPNKQRKYAHNAPLHIKNKFLSCSLTKSLKDEHSTKHIRVKIKDTVKILRGEHKGKTGEITKVSIKNSTVHIKDITRKKVNGQDAHIPIRPSNIQIIELDLKDEKRMKMLRKKKEQKKTDKTTNKTTTSNTDVRLSEAKRT